MKTLKVIDQDHLKITYYPDEFTHVISISTEFLEALEKVTAEYVYNIYLFGEILNTNWGTIRYKDDLYRIKRITRFISASELSFVKSTLAFLTSII